MSNLSTQIKIYAANNGVSKVDFLNDVRLVDNADGNGPHIEHWGLDIPEPTSDQLAAVENDANIEVANNDVRATRKAAYGDIGDQLDEIYKDIDAWKARIAQIKADNPKQ